MKPTIRPSASLFFAYICLSSSVAWSQVVPSSPVATPPIDTAIPALVDATGSFFEAPPAATDQHSVHEGRYTWAPDLVSPGTAVRSIWTGKQFPVPGALTYTAAPALTLHVNDALAAADTGLQDLDAGGIGSLFNTYVDVVNEIPFAHAGNVQLPTARKLDFFGYYPVRSRWLRSQWVPLGPIVRFGSTLYQQRVYDPPYAFQDVRLRGARFYCAARRSQLEQNGSRLSLGERVGFRIDIFGQHVDFMVIEPSISLNTPAKFFNVGDGAQAFTVPLLLGTAVEPIRGIGLPPLGEAQVPVVFVTADTEVKTFADKQTIARVGIPKLVPTYLKEHHTVTHSDAVLSAGFYNDQRFAVDTDFLLFSVGALNVRGLLTLTYDVGAFNLATTEVPDDRVLFGAPNSRTGHLYLNPYSGTQYHDGAWALAAHRGSPYFQWEVQPEGVTDPFWTFPIYPVIRPHDIRAVTNDDHVFSSATSLGVTLGLRGELGVNLTGPFTVTVDVTGSFTGGVTQHTVLRDALMAQGPVGSTIMRPFTSLTARPRQTAEVKFDGLKAGLHFTLDLGFFGPIEFDKVFFETPAQTVADYDSDASPALADEKNMLRIATGATTGQPMTQPNVLSHLPEHADFKTFLEDVPACLADTTPLPPPPPPCEPAAGSGTPPAVQMCLFGPELLLQENFIGQTIPAGVCPNIQGWLATLTLTGGQKLCLSKYLNFLCTPVSKEQVWNNVNVVSRVWNLESSMNDALLEMANECALAFVGEDVPPDDPEVLDKVKQMANGMVGAGPCTSDATLIPDSQIIQAVNPTTPPTAEAGKICK
jgi:hypothetical protein